MLIRIRKQSDDDDDDDDDGDNKTLIKIFAYTGLA